MEVARLCGCLLCLLLSPLGCDVLLGVFTTSCVAVARAAELFTIEGKSNPVSLFFGGDTCGVLTKHLSWN